MSAEPLKVILTEDYLDLKTGKAYQEAKEETYKKMFPKGKRDEHGKRIAQAKARKKRRSKR